MKIKVPASLDKFFAIDANKVAMVKIKMISVLKLPFRVSKILFISEKLKQRLKEKYVAVNNRINVVTIIAADIVNMFISLIPSIITEDTTARLIDSKAVKSFFKSMFSIKL